MKIPAEAKIALIIILSVATLVGLGSLVFLNLYEGIERVEENFTYDDPFCPGE